MGQQIRRMVHGDDAYGADTHMAFRQWFKRLVLIGMACHDGDMSNVGHLGAGRQSRGGGVAIADDHRLAVLSRIHPHATCPIRVLEGELNSLHIRVVEPDRRDGGVLIVRARPVEDGGVGHLQFFRPRVAWHAIWLDGLLQRHGQAQSRPAGIKRLQKILKLRLADLVPAIRPAVKS